MATVTIQGSSNKISTLSFDSQSNFVLAEQIAARITAGVNAGTIVTADDTDGTPPVLPPGVSGVFVQTESGLVVMPQGYSTDLVTKPGSAVVIGSGAPDETVLSGATTDLTFLAGSGSGTVVAGGGDNRVSVGGSGNWSLNTGGGNDIISALTAVSATIGAGAGHNAILLGSGNDLVASTGDDSIQGGSGAETVDATGAHSDFVQGINSHLLFVGGAGGATILGGQGSDTYFGSAAHTGKQLIVGGTAGDNVLFAGDGAGTLVGGGNNDQLYAYGSQNQLLVAGSGNETLSAAFSVGNDTLKAGSGHDLLVGGTGADTYMGGAGHTTVQAGSGSQTFQFLNFSGGGTEMVQGIFDPASIKIGLDGFAPGQVDQVLAHQTSKNGSVTIGLEDGTKVTFQDVSSLTKSNFV